MANTIAPKAKDVSVRMRHLTHPCCLSPKPCWALRSSVICERADGARDTGGEVRLYLGAAHSIWRLILRPAGRPWGVADVALLREVLMGLWRLMEEGRLPQTPPGWGSTCRLSVNRVTARGLAPGFSWRRLSDTVYFCIRYIPMGPETSQRKQVPGLLLPQRTFDRGINGTYQGELEQLAWKDK